MDGMKFDGFDRKGTAFLKGIERNNSRAWFEEHRNVYSESLLAPMQRFFTALAPVMLGIDPQFLADPRAGRGITRPHRDTRFSKDKSPYKSTIWLTYRRNVKEWQSYPAYYFEIMKDAYRYGVGFFMAERSSMDALRGIIDADPARIRRINALVKKYGYAIEGDSYARPLKQLPDELAVWYSRKNVYLMHERRHDAVLYSPAVLKEVSASFRALAPLYDLLMEAAQKKLQPDEDVKIPRRARNTFDF